MRDDAVCFVFGNLKCRILDAKTFPLAGKPGDDCDLFRDHPVSTTQGISFVIPTNQKNGEAGNILGGSLQFAVQPISLGVKH